MSGKKYYSVKEIADLTHSELRGDPHKTINNVADLETATKDDISFLANPRYEKAMRNSKAGAIFIHPELVSEKTEKILLISENPSRAFQEAIELFCPHLEVKTGFLDVHPTAVIHPSVKLNNVAVGPYAVIEEGASIAPGTTIGAHVYVGPYTSIGENCHIYPKVVIRERCLIGNRVIIQPGAIIGSCGFGYTQDKQGNHIKLNQVGTVVIEDDVEIGANSTIDRSRFKETRIGQGTKIDNLVQIGHGVKVGKNNIIISQSGIAGSSSTGTNVIIAGQVAVNGHIHITDNVIIAGKSGVSKSITKPGKYNGIPALPLDEYNRNTVYLRSIQKLVQKVKDLEKKT